MKLKNVIKNTFEEQEEKELPHISSLEKKIQAKIRGDKIRKSFWITKNPYAYATLVIFIMLFGFTMSSPVMAKSSIVESLISLKNGLQQESTNLLNSDPSYRDNNTQKYKQTRQEWCAVSARSPEEQEKAVDSIRDFIDKPGANVVYECVSRNPNKPDEKPQTESYTLDFDRFIIDTKTNRIIQMTHKEGTWGENKDGTRWFSAQKEYDYTPRYTQAEAGQLARDFIAKHEKALGKIDLDKLAFETGIKDDGTGKVNYFFIWKNKEQNVTIAFTQGGQLVSFFNTLAQ